MGHSPAVSSWPGRLRVEAARLAEGFRRSDRFFKMRVGVLTGWAALTLLTLSIACPSAGPANSLGADVRVLREAIVGGAQVMVRNDSDEVWTDVTVTLDGEWTYRQPTLRPDDELVVGTTQFQRGGEALPPDHRPRRLEVECDQGSHGFDLR